MIALHSNLKKGFYFFTIFFIVDQRKHHIGNITDGDCQVLSVHSLRFDGVGDVVFWTVSERLRTESQEHLSNSVKSR